MMRWLSYAFGVVAAFRFFASGASTAGWLMLLVVSLSVSWIEGNRNKLRARLAEKAPQYRELFQKLEGNEFVDKQSLNFALLRIEYKSIFPSWYNWIGWLLILSNWAGFISTFWLSRERK